jgi:hypothetical protein
LADPAQQWRAIAIEMDVSEVAEANHVMPTEDFLIEALQSVLILGADLEHHGRVAITGAFAARQPDASISVVYPS